jgi:serine/threonine protein kinase
MLMEFRLAKLGLESSSYTLCGTPEYLAPEQVRNQGHGKVQTHYYITTSSFICFEIYYPFTISMFT